MINELHIKTCPFCGKTPGTSVFGLDGKLVFRIGCTACETYKTVEEDSFLMNFGMAESCMQTVIEKWNRRADNG